MGLVKTMNDANAERDAEPSAPEGEAARAEAGEREAYAVIEALNAENGQLKDRVLRTLAEMENLRRRTEREVADAKAYGVSSFARDMLTVVDNLSRALEHRGRRTDRARPRDGARPPRGQAARSQGAEIRPQFSPGDLRGARRDGSRRHGLAGGPDRLDNRRSCAASGDGRRIQGRPESGPEGSAGVE